MKNQGISRVYQNMSEKESRNMDMQNQKCVMVMDEDLPLGVIANTAGIMGITLGKHMPETVCRICGTCKGRVWLPAQ